MGRTHERPMEKPTREKPTRWRTVTGPALKLPRWRHARQAAGSGPDRSGPLEYSDGFGACGRRHLADRPGRFVVLRHSSGGLAIDGVPADGGPACGAPRLCAARCRHVDLVAVGGRARLVAAGGAWRRDLRRRPVAADPVGHPGAQPGSIELTGRSGYSPGVG